MNFRQVIVEVHDLILHTFPKNIHTELLIDASVDDVLADFTELSQVVMNMAINARDAMPSGGKLKMELQNTLLPASGARQATTLPTGAYVLFRITDEGEGIAPHIIERIFDPFFTTKAQGKGTGLGLATSLGIVRSYGGDITVTSDLGIGTTFQVFLPALQSSAVLDTQVGKTVEGVGRGEWILVIDDEAFILESVRQAFQLSGYHVLTAASGKEGVRIFEEHASEVQLVLLDMMMPEMDGIETACQLRKLAPKLKIIASSGLKKPADLGEEVRWNGFIAKPYALDELLRMIRQTIDNGTSGS